jgi:hypothetical protein
MPRGNRYYLSGYVWHITHRCHKREFLLKFARDWWRWVQWLGEAKKRFGVIIRDNKGEEVIPQRMQLIAGRTGQEYNQRKNRKGAFWEDRYQARAVEAESHLSQCMVFSVDWPNAPVANSSISDDPIIQVGPIVDALLLIAADSAGTKIVRRGRGQEENEGLTAGISMGDLHGYVALCVHIFDIALVTRQARSQRFDQSNAIPYLEHGVTHDITSN